LIAVEPASGMDAQARRGALFLLVAPGLLAEVLSGNVVLTTWLQPLPFVLVALTYGVPVLLIRELVAARGLRILSIVLLGLAYGILNEGVLAKTLMQDAGPPLYDFAGYGRLGALQTGWAIFIVPWHALHSVVYPILLCNWMFPAAANRPWFSSGRARWLHYVLLVILVGLYSLYFLSPPPGDLATFVGYAVASGGLVAAALRFRAGPRASYPAEAQQASRTPALLGGCMLAFYLFEFWSPGRIPFALFVALVAGVLALILSCIARSGWRPVPDLLLFGLGDYLTFALFSMFVSLLSARDSLEALARGAIFLGLFLYLMRAVTRAPAGRGKGKGVGPR
jgi:hypothetical protein